MSKNPNCPISRIDLMIFCLLNKSPGLTRNSLKITWSLVLSFPLTVTLLIVAGSSSRILISTVIESFSTFVSTALTVENKYPLLWYNVWISCESGVPSPEILSFRTLPL